MEITSGKISGAQKIVVYGPEGIGKSTFASKFPGAIFIDTEGSTKQLDVARTPDPTSWTMLMSQVQYMINNPNMCLTLIIDTADWAERLCIQHICDKAGVDGLESFGYGKGYVYLGEEFGRLLNKLTELINIGVTVVLTAHAQMRKFEQPDEMGAYDRWEMKLQKKTTPLVMEWADLVLFANYKTYVVNVDGQGAKKGKNKPQDGGRVMYTTHQPCWDAKHRHGLPDEISFDYAQIAHLVPDKFITRGTGTVKPENKPTETTPVSQPAIEEKKQPNPSADPDFVETDEKFPEFPEQKTETKPAKNNVIQMPGIPKALQDLMKENNVSEAEIQEAVAGKGYYPLDTPIAKYDPQFIAGVLIAAWPQVHQMVKLLQEQKPF